MSLVKVRGDGRNEKISDGYHCHPIAPRPTLYAHSQSLFPMYRVGMVRSVSGEISGMSDNTHQRREQKLSTLCLVVLLIVLVLVIIGITLALVLTLLPSRRDQTPEVRTGPAVIELTTSLMQNFTDDLFDESSQVYRDLESKFSTMMYDLLSNATSPENIVKIEVLGFRNGSIIVNWRVIVTQLPDGVADSDDVTTNRNFQEFVRDTIRSGIDNGNLQGLPANINSIVVISVTFLVPDAMPSGQSPTDTGSSETCADEPCIGDATCQDLGNLGFICMCPPDRMGTFCEQAVTCPPLPSLENGFVMCTMANNVNSVCSYSCSDGFLLLGSTNRTCGENQQWIGITPACEAPLCELLPEIPGAVLFCSRGNAYQSICTYSCMDGFALEGGGLFVFRLCLADGRWTNSQPNCISTGCPPLVTPSNGAFSCDNGSNFGSLCTLSCNEGYRISNVLGQIRQCLTSGTWSGSPSLCLPNSCPALPSIPMGSISCSDGNNFLSTCTYTCAEGFILDNFQFENRVCGSNGGWSGLTPSCIGDDTVLNCPPLSVIPFGEVECTNGNLFESTCVYSCQLGYAIPPDIPNARTCGVEGEWIGPEPICVGTVTCPPLNDPPDGVVTCSNSNFYQSACNYSCSIGFTLSDLNLASRVCQLDGIWTGEQPVCVADGVSCPALADPPNGMVTCSSGEAEGSICVYSCNLGYTLDSPLGVFTRTCGSSGQWTGGDPSCAAVTCPDLSPINDGSFLCNQGFLFGSQCFYDCDVGFAIVNGQNSVRICGVDGQWTGEDPVCAVVTCPDLSPINDGSFSCNQAFLFGSQCFYDCDVGFTFVNGQNSVRICGVDGQWTGEDPVCTAITCEVLPDIDNGSMFCLNENFFGSLCIFSCNFGFDLIGTAVRECESTGIWSGTQPDCVITTPTACPTLQSVENAILSCSSGSNVSSTCTYTCVEGFTPVSGSTEGGIRICGTNGQWSGGSFFCTAIRCPTLISIAQGMVSCSNGNFYRSQCSYTCNPGYNIPANQDTVRICQINGMWTGLTPQCLSVTCDQLPPIANGQVICPSNPVFQSSCTYSCNPGYNLSSGTSTFTRTCQSSGQWDSFAPICRIVTCQPLFNINQATLTCTSANLYQSICTYTCNSGFTLVPDGSRVCQASGEWTGQDQQCIVSLCPALPAIPNGQVLCDQGNTIGTFCTYSCDAGYLLVPSGASQTCLVGGRWTGSNPVCQISACADLMGSLPGGTVSCDNGNNFQSQCMLSCLDGFASSTGADSVLTCGADGLWSGILIVCFDADCPTLPAVDFSVITCTSGNGVGSVCTYTCQVGYNIVGDAERICIGNNMWTGQEPVCTLVVCPRLGSIANGVVICSDESNFNSVCTYICSNNFEVVSGSSSRSCQADGTWSGFQPTCGQVTCPSLTAVANGAVPDCTNGFGAGSICTYQCNNGFEIRSGTSSRTCDGSTQMWSGTEPTCVQVTCPSLPAITNSIVPLSCTNQFFAGSTCTYECNIGFTIGSGSPSRTCSNTGSWSGSQPSCIQVTCPSLPAITNGIVPLSCTNQFFAGSTCTYECNIGFTIGSGSPSRTCSNTGSWSGSQPSCIQDACPPLTAVSNGATVDCTAGFAPGSVCTYQCNIGFEIVSGSAVRICNGATFTWSDTEPVCAQITCPDLPAIINGAAPSCSNGFVSGSICTYQCNIGFQIGSGSSTRTCNAITGTWSGTEPTCVQIVCPTLLAVPNSMAPSCTNGFFVGSFCSYECNFGYEIGSGSATRVCTANTGSWSGSEPTCVGILCPNLGAVSNGLPPTCTNGFAAGSICMYECNAGFEIGFGSASRTCDAVSRSWSGTEPTCVEILCPNLGAVSNGLPPTCTNGFAAGSICMYECNAGFEIGFGSASRTCDAVSRSWSGTEPTCVETLCPNLGAVSNGLPPTCTNGFAAGSICMYECNAGFEIGFGSVSRTCDAVSRSWSGTEPTCVEILCPNLGAVSNGLPPTCTNGFAAGSICMYECNAGFEIGFGSASRTCDAVSRSWSGTEPTCVETLCPNLGAVSNGLPPTCTNGFAAGSICMYECNAGFEIGFGSASRTCDAVSRSWSGTEPTCIEKCNPLQNIANAVLACTNDNIEGSTCTYTCNNGWTLMAGQSGSRVCSSDGTWTGEQPTCEIVCGSRPAFIEPRIVNGELSREGAWPWLASLRSTSGNHQCGGALIDPEWVLTAAHCIVGSISTIVLGDILLDTQTANHQEFSILDGNTFTHPDYNDFTQRNDIALIKLPEPAVYNDYVRPLCLNTNTEEETTFDTCFVAGWGFTVEDGGVASNELYEARIPFFDRTQCETRYIILGIRSTQFCAGYQETDTVQEVPDACQGDSGGPYMCYDQTTDTWTDVGVVSFGVGCGTAGIPGVYTRVSMYMDFINDIIANN